MQFLVHDIVVGQCSHLSSSRTLSSVVHTANIEINIAARSRLQEDENNGKF